MTTPYYDHGNLCQVKHSLAASCACRGIFETETGVDFYGQI
jgi:hypothetical protein